MILSTQIQCGMYPDGCWEARGDRQAIEIYQQAANQYKMAKMWQEAPHSHVESCLWDGIPMDSVLNGDRSMLPC